ncbi:Hypothetical predicted protein [Cloeon dipterum]|uniref:Uncharacterized protein n=1 Tax=Cloeon dipterum TaxID=197152 RepID=A0A8S1CNH4_9INSE|nr:Hypothetical predicted protein [Cloeon dipterum]
MSGIERKETSAVNSNSDSDDSSKLVIDEDNLSQEIAETPLDRSGRKRLIELNEDDSDCSESEVEVVSRSSEMQEPQQTPLLDLSVQDNRMPREFWNPSGQHSPKRQRMEDRGVDEMALPSTNDDYDLPGTWLGSNQPMIQDLIPLILNCFREQHILQEIFLQQLLQQGDSDSYLQAQAEAVPPASAQSPEHPSGCGSQCYVKLNKEDRECPFEPCSNSGRVLYSRFDCLLQHMRQSHDNYQRCVLHGCYCYFEKGTKRGFSLVRFLCQSQAYLVFLEQHELRAFSPLAWN